MEPNQFLPYRRDVRDSSDPNSGSLNFSGLHPSHMMCHVTVDRVFFAQSPRHKFTWSQTWVKSRVNEIRMKLYFTLTLVKQENLRLFCENEGPKIIVL